MTKKLLSLLICLALCFSFCLFVSADDTEYRLIDNARLLTSSEKEEIINKLDEISKRQKFDIIILTVDSIGTMTPEKYAERYYDQSNLGYGGTTDGILLLISMENRDFCITSGGVGTTYFTSDGREYICNKVKNGGLSDDNFSDAFLLFSSLCDDFVTQGKTGVPYDNSNLPKDPFDIGGNIIVALVVGLIVAFIATQSMKSKLKTVHAQTRAEQYVKHGSLNMTRSHDFFLYRVVNRRPRPKQSSGGSRSSGGRSSSGKF